MICVMFSYTHLSSWNASLIFSVHGKRYTPRISGRRPVEEGWTPKIQGKKSKFYLFEWPLLNVRDKEKIKYTTDKKHGPVEEGWILKNKKIKIIWNVCLCVCVYVYVRVCDCVCCVCVCMCVCVCPCVCVCVYVSVMILDAVKMWKWNFVIWVWMSAVEVELLWVCGCPHYSCCFDCLHLAWHMFWWFIKIKSQI